MPCWALYSSSRYFYPRSPCGERRAEQSGNKVDHNFYPRSPCGERRPWGSGCASSWLISIHALLAESDRRSSKTGRRFRYFYPRSPCGERRRAETAKTSNADISIHALLAESDADQEARKRLEAIFLSTLSLRRATFCLCGLIPFFDYFYPRSPCGERPILKVYGYGDNKFLSTLSLRRATYPSIQVTPLNKISIHALLAESDVS